MKTCGHTRSRTQAAKTSPHILLREQKHTHLCTVPVLVLASHHHITVVYVRYLHSKILWLTAAVSQEMARRDIHT